MKEITNLKTNKALQSSAITTKPINSFMYNVVNGQTYVWPFYNFMHERVKGNSYIFGDLHLEITTIVFSILFFFSNSLKNAIVIPVHKKGAKTSKDNYRSVSILSNISKIYERLTFRKRSEYFEPILSKF